MRHSEKTCNWIEGWSWEIDHEVHAGINISIPLRADFNERLTTKFMQALMFQSLQGQPVNIRNDVDSNIDIAHASRGTIHLNPEDIEFSLPLDPHTYKMTPRPRLSPGHRAGITTVPLMQQEVNISWADINENVGDAANYALPPPDEYCNVAILQCCNNAETEEHISKQSRVSYRAGHDMTTIIPISKWASNSFHYS